MSADPNNRYAYQPADGTKFIHELWECPDCHLHVADLFQHQELRCQGPRTIAQIQADLHRVVAELEDLHHELERLRVPESKLDPKI